MSDPNEDLDIDLSMDSLNWPAGSGITGGSVSWNLGGSTPPAVGSAGSSSIGVTGSSPLWSTTPQNLSLNFSMNASTTKTGLQYIIVLEDGQCLELDEQNPITSREMIGLSKFFNMITMFLNASNLKVNWSELMNELNIQRHFTAGLTSMHQYPTNTETLYVFLIDDK